MKTKNSKQLIFAATGKFENFTRDSLKLFIESKGHKLLDKISNQANYLINNEIHSSSTKNSFAKENNMPIITEYELKRLINESDNISALVKYYINGDQLLDDDEMTGEKQFKSKIEDEIFDNLTLSDENQLEFLLDKYAKDFKQTHLNITIEQAEEITFDSAVDDYINQRLNTIYSTYRESPFMIGNTKFQRIIDIEIDNLDSESIERIKHTISNQKFEKVVGANYAYFQQIYVTKYKKFDESFITELIDRASDKFVEEYKYLNDLKPKDLLNEAQSNEDVLDLIFSITNSELRYHKNIFDKYNIIKDYIENYYYIMKKYGNKVNDTEYYDMLLLLENLKKHYASKYTSKFNFIVNECLNYPSVPWEEYNPTYVFGINLDDLNSALKKLVEIIEDSDYYILDYIQNDF